MTDDMLGVTAVLVGCKVVSKFAVSVMGLFIIIAGVGLEVPLKQPAPLQDQVWKVNPVFGVAITLTTEAALYHSLDGLVVPAPEGETLIVKKY